MDLGLNGKVGIVAAASKGLGRSSAAALAAEGCKLVINSRDPDAIGAVAAELPGETVAVAGDMSDPSTPQRLVDAAVERFGALHIVVANNGGPPPGKALDVDDAAIEAAVNANTLASIRLIRAAVPHMRDAGWGRICCITSAAVKQPIPFLSLSNLSRTGLWAWAKTAAMDLAEENITLNLACPGLHATDRIKQLGGGGGRMGDPDDFGKAVAFLCSEPAKFITGTALQIDGGATSGLL